MGRSEIIIQMDWNRHRGVDKLNRLWTQITEMNVNLRPTISLCVAVPLWRGPR